MNKNDFIEKRQEKNKEIRLLTDEAKKSCASFFTYTYKYNDKEATEELGLDKELIHQLLEDYVTQIIKSVIRFEELIEDIHSGKDSQKDLIELHELAHKNLGVARNLRIKDAEMLLNDLMKKDDLEYLHKCAVTLRACAIVLKPEHAFNAIKFIEVKRNF